MGTSAGVALWESSAGEVMSQPVRNATLLAGLRRGDRQAAEALLAGSYRLVYAALFRLCGGDADLAADLTQETYRKAWQALAGFDGRAEISTWLYRIAYNTFLNHLRRPRPLLDDGLAAARLVDPAPAPDDAAVAGQEAERLRRAVLGLPEDLRFTVSAHFWSELPVREIAALENITTVAVRKRLARAFARLRLALEEDAR
jgi:RNA polymerase sigma-70 factor, ECF subfamily